MQINTASGAIDSADLGKTLMHEHLVIGFPGWESDGLQVGQNFREMVAVCVDKVEELKTAGFSTILDPCPNDLGRDPQLMAEVASQTGFNIIFATGLYHEHLGGAPYWRTKFAFDPDGWLRLSDLLIKELTEGVGDTGIKAGVIKVGTAMPPITEYEKTVFQAAARASLATGAPITTHTDAVLGDEQIDLLVSLGVPANRIIVGHCCGSSDHAYHRSIVERGAYIGLDRFGSELIYPDEERITSMLKLLESGAARHIIMSHDHPWCFRGNMIPPAIKEQLENSHQSMHITRVITPRLIAAGVEAETIDSILTDNPRRYFENGNLAAA